MWRPKEKWDLPGAPAEEDKWEEKGSEETGGDGIGQRLRKRSASCQKLEVLYVGGGLGQRERARRREKQRGGVKGTNKDVENITGKGARGERIRWMTPKKN